MSCKINLGGCGIAIYSNLLCESCVVANVVGNFKCYGVKTVGKNDIFNTHRVAFCMSSRNLYTVDINCGGRVVKSLCIRSRIIGNICVKRQFVGCYRLIIKLNICICCTVCRICDNGSIAVIYCCAVIKSNVIVVECHYLRS